MNTNDLHNAALYKVNGIVCDLADYNGKFPTVEDVRNNWRMKLNGTNDVVSDEEIENIIRLVERQDMGLWN